MLLHRVSADSAGVLARETSDPDGTFSFRLPRVPDPGGRDDVYFASVRYREILYFGEAVTRAVQLDSIYRIEVHDTALAAPVGAPLPVSVRNLFVERAEDGWRVVDLIQIRNDGDRTLVAREDGVVWSYPLPESAGEFEVGESDLAPDAVTFAGGRIRVASPVPPGQRTYLVRYRLPELAFSLPLPGPTGRLEILVEEPSPPLDAPGLTRLEPVEIEAGRTYQRYTASGLENRVIEVSPGDEAGGLPVRWIAVILAVVLTGAGILALRRQPGIGDAPTAPADTAADRESVLLRIAELDDRFQERDRPSEEERARYREERARLKARLRELD